MLKEFRDFIARGNVVDLAVGVVIGGAFGKIVTSIVSDVVMPPIGLLLGKVDFSSLFLSIGEKKFDKLVDAKAAGAPTLNYGLFLNTIIEFLIVASVIFLVVKAINRVYPKPTATKVCRFCLEVIPLKAVRCGHCTSQLEGKADAGAA